jgi:hypothetical protein
LVSGTKGPGFDPRVALHQVPKIIRIVVLKNRVPTVSEAPFEGPSLFAPQMTFEPPVGMHRLSILDHTERGQKSDNMLRWSGGRTTLIGIEFQLET